MSIAETAAMGAQRAWYGAAQLARIAWYTGHYVAGRRTMGPLTRPGEAPPAEEYSGLDRARLRVAFRDLFRDDWRNIEAGVYRMPIELRRPPSLGRLARQSRDYFEDAALIARRRLANGHSEVLRDDLSGKYPRYFLQNFHFQSDGWLSAASADRYGMQVETLFTGAGAAMRRQALPLIARAIGARDPAGLAYLDLACGDGSFIQSVLDNWPALSATALDLSPAYLGKARAALSAFRRVRFVEAKAEKTGLADESFDIVTAVSLFHELPPRVRPLQPPLLQASVAPPRAFAPPGALMRTTRRTPRRRRRAALPRTPTGKAARPNQSSPVAARLKDRRPRLEQRKNDGLCRPARQPCPASGATRFRAPRGAPRPASCQRPAAAPAERRSRCRSPRRTAPRRSSIWR